MTYSAILLAQGTALNKPTFANWSALVSVCIAAERAVRDQPFLGRSEFSQLDLISAARWTADAQCKSFAARDRVAA